MAYISALEVCRQDLFMSRDELARKYNEVTAEKVLRIRGMYMWMLENPESRDNEFVKRCTEEYRVSRPAAYDDLRILKSLMPSVAEASRDFARWRYNEMILETYKLAKEKKDTKSMEKAASSYAKYNKLDVPEEMKMPYDEIVIQPFTATEDPRTLGIEPIPMLQDKINAMLKKYKAESMDVEDVDFEYVDLEEDDVFGSLTEKEDGKAGIL